MKIQKHDLYERLDKLLLQQLRSDQEFVIKTSNPKEFLTFNRLDLSIKLLFLESQYYSHTFGERIYKDHINAFTNGSYQEPGNPNKNSYNKYRNLFRSLSGDIDSKGFDRDTSLIPTSENGTLLNGAHRTASAIFYNRNITTVQLPLSSPCYDAKYFLDRGLPEQDIELAVTRLVENADNCYVALLWPRISSMHANISSYFDNVIYQKDIYFSHLGAHNLLTQIYAGANWIGTPEENFKGVSGKLDPCFDSNGPLRVIAFQSESLDKSQNCKLRIRRSCGVGNHSVHITDTKQEAIDVARLLFNRNSLHFLNNAHPTKYKSRQQALRKYRQAMHHSSVQSQHAILDGGMILASYGLRETDDIDYLNIGEKTLTDKEIDNHEDQLHYHGVSKAELIMNPRYFFYSEGLKFVSLEQLYRMKASRGSGKDRDDISLIKSVLQNRRSSHIISALFNNWIILRRKAKLHLKGAAKTILSKAGLHEPLQRVRHRRRNRP